MLFNNKNKDRSFFGLKGEKKFRAWGGLALLMCFILAFLQRAGGVQDQETPQVYRLNDFVMSTVLTAVVYGREDVTGEIKTRLDALEHQKLSWRDPESTVALINEKGSEKEGIELDQEFLGWTRQSLDLARESGGAFDPSIGDLTRLWNIEGDNPKVPSDQELSKVMKEIGYERIHLKEGESGGTLKLDGKTSLDLGAVGKGIACDVVRDYLKEKRVDGAVVSVGGSILVYGTKPDEKDWKVAIQDPRAEDGDYMGALDLKGDQVVSTSGDYEKYFEEDGVRYHHILDPHTGYPADNGLISVTVVCENGLLSDGLSTACFVLGREKGLELLKWYGAEAVLIDKEKKVTVTDGLKDTFTLMKDDYAIAD